MLYRSELDYEPWLYVADVQKRTLQLPADASIVVNKEDMVNIRVSLAGNDADLLAKPMYLDFRTKADANLPLFLILVRPEDHQKWQANGWQIEKRILPGTYFVKMVMDAKKEFDMGVLEISGEPGKTYPLKVIRPAVSE